MVFRTAAQWTDRPTPRGKTPVLASRPRPLPESREIRAEMAHWVGHALHRAAILRLGHRVTGIRKALLDFWLSHSRSTNADPIAVWDVQGTQHGFLALRDMNNKLLASGDSLQVLNGDRITEILTFHFKDGSDYEERAVFSQRRTFQLLTYGLVQKWPSFKTQQMLSFDTSTGRINVLNTDEHGKRTTTEDHIILPADLTSGMLSTLLTNLDANGEHTLSMLVATPKPRIVKLKYREQVRTDILRTHQ
jgi:hypothetical protein